MNDRMTDHALSGTDSLSLHVGPLPALPVVQIEKFSAAELTGLRNELVRGQLDSWQAAAVAATFLAGHGYGANADSLRTAIAGVEIARCSNDCLQAALEGVAYIQ